MSTGEPKKFEVTEQHLKLLRHAYVGWDGCEFGAPAIDCKRPYGNSDVFTDIGEILDIEPIENVDYGGEYEFTDAQRKHMRELHNETQTALQIVLATGEFKAGAYQTSGAYSIDWSRV